MLFTLAYLIIILGATTGWGLGTVWVFGKFGVSSPYRFDFLLPLVGLVVGTVLVNLENFFYPVSFAFALLFILVGWGFFIIFARRWLPFLKQPFWIGCVMVWLGVISTQAVLSPANYDSGLYHMPAIRWLVDSAVPFGLANFHGRLGFNSSWFSISALLAQLGFPNTANYTALASETLLAVVGIAVLGAFRKFLRGARELSTSFLLVSGLVGLAPVVVKNLSSPSTDHPVLLLAIVLVYIFLRAVRTSEPNAFLYEFWLAALVAAFIITIKFSVLPLALIPLALLVIGLRRRIGIGNWKSLAVVVMPAAVVLASWMARGVALSGCLLYPLSLSCFWNLPWAVPTWAPTSDALWIMSWARAPGNLERDQVLSQWFWLGPWLTKFITSNDFILPLICFAVGVGLCLPVWRKLYARDELRAVLLPGAISFAGMLYWFFTAPDLRFGSTWFWLPGLLALGLAISAFVPFSRMNLAIQAVMGIILVAAAITIAYPGISFVRHGGKGFRAALVTIPPVPSVSVKAKQTTRGVTVYVPTQGDRCYWSPFCTNPDFNPDLGMTQLSDNRIVFYGN